MKKLIILSVFLINAIAFGQIHKPVKWSTSVKKISDTDYELIATATIDTGWHLYSQRVPEGGPIPTTFTFEEGNTYTRFGGVAEEKGHTVQDKIFNMKIKYFDTKAVFKQRIKVNGSAKFKVAGFVEFMVCNDTSCLPPTEVELEFDIN